MIRSKWQALRQISTRLIRRIRIEDVLAVVFLVVALLLHGCTVKMGSQTEVLRENKEGTAIAPLKDITVTAKRLQDDGSIRDEEVTIKERTVVRVGIECVFKDVNQILTQEDCEFDAMVPDASARLVISHIRIPKLTGIKLGTNTMNLPPNTSTTEPSK